MAGCAGPLSALEPAGPAGAAVDRLWNVMLVASAILFGATMVLLALAWFRSRWLVRVPDGVWLAVGGVAVPVAVLTPLAVYGFVIGERHFARPGQPDLTVEAIAYQWAWEFAYPDAEGVRTAGVLHIPAGARIDVRLNSRDVIHSFWVPRLAGKMDVIPGHTNILRIVADRPGVYRGVCTEYCGPGHASMEFAVEAHEPAAYAEALRQAAGGAR